MGHYGGQMLTYTSKKSFLGPFVVMFTMSTGKMTGKRSWKEDEDVQSVTQVVFMSSPKHSMSGWD